jgi:hypothetical protein
VCVGGFDLDAVVAIAVGIGAGEFEALELLASLVAKSLVERNELEGVTRYRLLEMIRQYAAEQLNATGAAEAARDDHAQHYLALAVAQFGEMSTEADYQALDRLEAETANIAAAARWLLASERIAELVQFFDDVPFFDGFAAPVTVLQELSEIAAVVVERTEAAALPGYANTCWIATARALADGDIAKFGHLTDLAKAVSDREPPPTTRIMETMVATWDGDLELGVSLGQRAVERARHEGDPAQLAWILATLGMVEAMHGSDRALPTAEEALAVAHRQGGTLICLHPLKAVMGAATNADPARVLEAAEEAARIDRTQRQESVKIGRSLVARIRMTRGEVAEALTEMREVLRSYVDNGQRTDLALALMTLSGALAGVAPLVAVEIGAIVESDAIASLAPFATPDFAALVEKLATEIDAARTRAASMSYDDALAFVFDAIDRLIAEQGLPGDTSWPGTGVRA